jgi:transcription termination factor Rho
MTKAELESKHLSELHLLAAEAGVPRFRMLSRTELIEQLSDGSGSAERGGRSRSGGGGASRSGSREQRSGSGEQRDRQPRRRRRPSGERERGQRQRPERGERQRSERGGRKPPDRERSERGEREERPRPTPPEPAPEPAPAAPSPSGGESRPRRRRRRRFGRRGKGELTIQDLLLPPAAGRQAILCAETREGCTALLRGVAADLSGSKGPDPVVLLIDPSPEELADWKREAPQAEIVAAGQARHADDALAQASTRASGGDDVILLVDSLTRFGTAFGDAEAAGEFFDAGRAQAGAGGGSLTVVAALERS